MKNDSNKMRKKLIEGTHSGKGTKEQGVLVQSCCLTFRNDGEELSIGCVMMDFEPNRKTVIA